MPVTNWQESLWRASVVLGSVALRLAIQVDYAKALDGILGPSARIKRLGCSAIVNRFIICPLMKGCIPVVLKTPDDLFHRARAQPIVTRHPTLDPQGEAGPKS